MIDQPPLLYNKSIKLSILVSHPIQYFTPVYRELAARNDVDLTVFFRTRVGLDSYHDSGFRQAIKWDIPLLDGYRHIFLSNKTILTGFEPSVLWCLYHNRPDVILVHGYSHPTNILAIAWAKLFGIKVLLRGDTWLSPHHVLTSWLKRLFKRILFFFIDGFLCIGSLNRDYYVALGAKKDQLFFAPFCVDNRLFSVEGADRDRYRISIRNELGIPMNAVVILYASKMLTRKRAMDLLDAFVLFRHKKTDVWLLYVGSGEEEQGIRDAVSKKSIDHVVFAGFQNQTILPQYYVASDIFVLPSTEEPWGLVVNEVMASGLPVVVTDEVGAAPDLVEGKETGFIYPCGDINALAAILLKLIELPDLRQAMGTNAKKIIANWDVIACVRGHVEAIQKLTG